MPKPTYQVGDSVVLNLAPHQMSGLSPSITKFQGHILTIRTINPREYGTESHSYHMEGELKNAIFFDSELIPFDQTETITFDL